MADINIGTAYVTVTASTRGMVKDVADAFNGVSKSAASAGAAAGTGFGGKLAAAAKGGLGTLGAGLQALAPVGKAIGDGIVLGIKGATAAIGAAASGIAALGKAAVSSYADFEQLSGGTELLFGGASEYIMQASQEAFKTVQMSQNDYLQQVNGFAVGLKTALGGDEMAAAQLATKIIQAEADIAAATGNSSESIQNAFNGIMKGNFTMLDNLQLGITPTKEGFQEMIDSVNAWNAAQGNATSYTIDNMADCQAALVDYVAMQGLAGHAGAEAASTIQGSVSTMQAAWSNFLTALGTGEIEGPLNDLVDSVTTVLDNIIPIIERFMDTVAKALPQMVEKLMPAVVGIVTRIAQMIPELLPVLTEGITQAVQGIAAVLPEIIPVLLDAIIQIVLALITTVADLLPTLVPMILDAAVTLFMGLVQAVPQVVGALLNTVDALLGSVFSAIAGAVGNMVSSGLQFMGGLLNGVTTGAGNVLSFIAGIPGRILQALGNVGSLLVNAGRSIIDGLLGGLKAGWDGITGFVGGIGDWIVSHKGPPSYDARMLTPNGRLIMESLGKGMRQGFASDVTHAMRDINDGIKREFSGAGLTKSLSADVRYNAAGDWKNVMGERPVIILNDAVLNDDYEMRQSALSLLKDIRRAAEQ